VTDQKQYNELAARLQRLETLLQNNDAYSDPGAVKLADMDMGPGLDFSIPEFDYGGDTQWDQAWDPNEYADWQNEQAQFNEGFGESQSTINELLARLNAVETFLSGGSNDTAQDFALDWGSETGDDGQTGSGTAAENLGLGTLSTQNANDISVTGGSIDGVYITNAPSVTVVNSSDVVVATLGASASSDGQLLLTDETGANTATVGINSTGGLELSTGSTNPVTIGGSAVGATVGFFGSAGVTKPQVNGSRAGNAALASLITALASMNQLTDSSSP
jgi:hypothetical protein